MSTHSTSLKTETRQAVTAHTPHRIKLVKNHNYVKNGRKSYAHALRKYNIKPTIDGPFKMVDDVPGDHHMLHKLQNRIRGKPSQAAHRRLLMIDDNGQTTQVPAEDIQNDTMYLADVWSSELSKNLQVQGKAAHHNIFDEGKSDTWKASPGQHWSITYGDGSNAGGNVGTDNVAIGGIMIKNQAVEVANRMSQQFRQFAGDGLLGLAFSSINEVRPIPVKTPVENMIAQSTIPSSAELFTAYLGSTHDKNDPDHGDSFYTFGYIDESTVKSTGSEIKYTPVDNSSGFWQVSSQGYSVNNETFHTTGNTAIMDTGTTLALVDDQACKNIYSKVPGAKIDSSQGGYVFPSNTPLTSLPVVKIDIGGQQYNLNKEDLAFAPIGNGMSFGGIQSRGDMPFDILGDTFLKNVYAVFDVGGMRFGCVQRVDPDGTAGMAGAAGAAGASPAAAKV